MKKTKDRIKKPLIFLIFIIAAYLSSIQKLKEIFHYNNDLKMVFDEGALAADYAIFAYLFLLIISSFFMALLAKTLWNILIPKITNWRKIDYWEAMGIMSIILLVSVI
tara:strand:+ start:105 stop:428 length:324 start_codon:yes stop_codon:yes gene_type:complete